MPPPMMPQPARPAPPAPQQAAKPAAPVQPKPKPKEPDRPASPDTTEIRGAMTEVFEIFMKNNKDLGQPEPAKESAASKKAKSEVRQDKRPKTRRKSMTTATLHEPLHSILRNPFNAEEMEAVAERDREQQRFLEEEERLRLQYEEEQQRIRNERPPEQLNMNRLPLLIEDRPPYTESVVSDQSHQPCHAAAEAERYPWLQRLIEDEPHGRALTPPPTFHDLTVEPKTDEGFPFPDLGPSSSSDIVTTIDIPASMPAPTTPLTEIQPCSAPLAIANETMTGAQPVPQPDGTPPAPERPPRRTRSSRAITSTAYWEEIEDPDVSCWSAFDLQVDYHPPQFYPYCRTPTPPQWQCDSMPFDPPQLFNETPHPCRPNDFWHTEQQISMHDSTGTTYESYTSTYYSDIPPRQLSPLPVNQDPAVDTNTDQPYNAEYWR